MRPKEQKREKIQTSNQPKLVVSLVAPYRSLQCTSPWNQVAERPNAAAGWLPVATPTREAVAKVLERLFITYLFRVWNSFLVCSPPYGARVFCGDDPVEAGDLQVDRIKVAVAAGSDTSLGQEMLEDRFLSFGIVYFRFCQAGELRHALLAWSLWCVVSQEMSVWGWLRCWVAQGYPKRSNGQIRVDVWNSELPVCDVGWRLAGFRGMLTPAHYRREVFWGVRALQSGNDTARSTGV
jgi:hypothetical protein